MEHSPIRYSIAELAVTAGHSGATVKHARSTDDESVRGPVTAQHDQPQASDLSRILASNPCLKIGEVAKLLGVKPHVLRYWESEFASLRPQKNASGQRMYTKADIEAIVEIKNLLYNERYTISGAKQMLARQEEDSPPLLSAKDATLGQTLASLKEHIHTLLALLERVIIP
jgi:DNA-binding transcriptional MerR regulator